MLNKRIDSWLIISLLLSATMLLNCSSSPQNSVMEKDALTLSSKIPMPDVSGRIDHIAYDAATHRAFVAALGNNTVEVVDLRTKKVAHSIRDLKEPQGIVYIPSSNRLVVANGDDGIVIFFDATTFQILSSVALKSDADNVRYDATSNLIYVGYGSGSIASIDAGTMKQTTGIPLDGHPESFQLAKQKNRLYVNVPDENKIQVADLTTHKVIANWKNTSASSNFPMALDENNNRLFVGCRSPAKLRVIDTKTGNELAVLNCAGDADDVFYNATDSLIFVSGGSGYIDVFKSENQNKISLINHITSASGARTSLWLPDEKKLLLAVPARSGNEAQLWIYDFKNY
jgi:DNA-binding beta-propeller fold protein YncE